uniref:Uncharacterized protein n=1 Tax=Trichuris muris TaxID=70415 RepID=A0A5S6Q006_TRIMR
MCIKRAVQLKTSGRGTQILFTLHGMVQPSLLQKVNCLSSFPSLTVYQTWRYRNSKTILRLPSVPPSCVAHFCGNLRKPSSRC